MILFRSFDAALSAARPSAERSRTVTRWPKRASSNAVEAPNAPAPITITCVNELIATFQGRWKLGILGKKNPQGSLENSELIGHRGPVVYGSWSLFGALHRATWFLLCHIPPSTMHNRITSASWCLRPLPYANSPPDRAALGTWWTSTTPKGLLGRSNKPRDAAFARRPTVSLSVRRRECLRLFLRRRCVGRQTNVRLLKSVLRMHACRRLSAHWRLAIW